MRRNKRLNLTFKQQQQLGGFLFSLPFLIGFAFFFVKPMIQSVRMSLSELTLTSNTFELEFTGVRNFKQALLVHPTFVRIFTEVFVELVATVPLIIGFSLFVAMLLNQDFKGRTLARVMFFLPVIMGAGVVMKMEINDFANIVRQDHINEVARFGSETFRFILDNSFLPEQLIDFVVDVAESLPTVIRASGVQILIFLAGLQSIPRSVYEAANVEGATAWEGFWLITFPMLTPLILTNAIYTIIDSFIRMDNELVLLIRETMFGGDGYGVGMAMAMIYFAAIAVVLGIVYAVLSKRISYQA